MRGMDNLRILLLARLCIRLEVELVTEITTAAHHSARNHLRIIRDNLRIVPWRLADSNYTLLY